MDRYIFRMSEIFLHYPSFYFAMHLNAIEPTPIPILIITKRNTKDGKQQ